VYSGNLARAVRHHDRPHSSLDYRTPNEFRTLLRQPNHPHERENSGYQWVRKRGQVTISWLRQIWASGSPNLLRDILRDLVRLDLIRQHAQDALFILAGELKAIRKLFQTAAFEAVPEHPNSRTLLPLNLQGQAARSGLLALLGLANVSLHGHLLL
jgi:hypothetical protein